jgi:hypothetical protein
VRGVECISGLSGKRDLRIDKDLKIEDDWQALREQPVPRWAQYLAVVKNLIRLIRQYLVRNSSSCSKREPSQLLGFHHVIAPSYSNRACGPSGSFPRLREREHQQRRLSSR